MDLFGELHELAKREREVDETYLDMAKQCEIFALDLLQVICGVISRFTCNLLTFWLRWLDGLPVKLEDWIRFSFSSYQRF